MIKKGSIVRIKNRRGIGWNSDGDMDCWMGKTVKISSIIPDSNELNVKICDDGRRWFWNIDDFEEITNVEISEYMLNHPEKTLK